MEAWPSILPILKRKFLLTRFAGIAAAVINVVIFLAADDRILLILGAFLLWEVPIWTPPCPPVHFLAMRNCQRQTAPNLGWNKNKFLFAEFFIPVPIC